VAPHHVITKRAQRLTDNCHTLSELSAPSTPTTEELYTGR